MQQWMTVNVTCCDQPSDISAKALLRLGLASEIKRITDVTYERTTHQESALDSSQYEARRNDV